MANRLLGVFGVLARVSAAAVAVSGCATVNSGDYGVALDDTGHRKNAPPISDPLKISAGELPGLSSLYFGVIEVTFENNSPDWIQIDRLDLDFGTPEKNQSVFISWGADLETWARAIVRQRQIRTLDERLLLGLIGDMQIGAAASQRVADTAGGTVALPALAALEAEDPGAAAEPARARPRFPPTHLLRLPLRVPPGLFVKRWLLLNTAAQPAGGCIDSMILGYDTADHKHGRVLLTLRNNPYAIEQLQTRWQARCTQRPTSQSYQASAR